MEGPCTALGADAFSPRVTSTTKVCNSWRDGSEDNFLAAGAV